MGRELSSSESNIDFFPLPIDKVAFLDIDGTLIDRTYNITDPNIYQAIQNTQENGWILGLSSDTPYEAMRIWSKRFGLNGPIVAEKGSVTEYKDELQYDKYEAELFLASRSRIEEAFKDQGINIWLGNPVEAIREGNKLGDEGDLVVLINELRKCSLSFFVRRVQQDGSLGFDARSTEDLIDTARTLYPDYEDLVEDVNHDFGLLIVARDYVSKRYGSKRLMRSMRVGQFGMIGNSIADYVGSDIATHYAVGDANVDFKKVADYVSEKPLTSGVVDILGRLAAS
jgi:hydroxymethylpyrimidine pyrophosphatase-like HAD family hydrolase